MTAAATISDLLDRYDGFLVDAYGVLNDSHGALPGAAALVDALERRGRPWLLVTNDASRLPATIAARLAGFGVAVPAARVLGSGELLGPHFAAHGLAGRATVVLGTDESRAMVRAAGGVPVALGDDADVVVVADDAGYPLLPAVEAVINACVRALDRGAPLALVLPNPDLVYPRPDGFGITAGAIAALIETALRRVRPAAPRFVGLGKPYPPIYAEARRRLGPGRLLAIGDSLDTDIAGALAAGIDAAMVQHGVDRWRPGVTPAPTWLLATIEV